MHVDFGKYITYNIYNNLLIILQSRYGNFEMLHVSAADSRRLSCGHITIQHISRKSWWTPCFVYKQSKQIIELPGDELSECMRVKTWVVSFITTSPSQVIRNPFVLST